MRKQIWMRLMAAILVLGLLSACGSKEPKVTDTIRWFNGTYAGITVANSGDYNLLGSYKRGKITEFSLKQSLEASWGVSDRATAEQALADLISDGHSPAFASDMRDLEEAGWFEFSREEIEEINLANYGEEGNAWFMTMVDAYLAEGEDAIIAWDLCRGLQLLGTYYVVGYYTAEESLDQSLEIATRLQQQFESWDEMIQSYMWGYQYWSEDEGDTDSPTAERWAQINQVKEAEDSPYLLDWKLPLEKSW